MFNKEIFSSRVKGCRKEKGVSQTVLAKLLGVSPQQIADIENGKSSTSIERLYILADYFSVSMDYLVGHDEK